jgi:hypothetical protein
VGREAMDVEGQEAENVMLEMAMQARECKMHVFWEAWDEMKGRTVKSRLWKFTNRSRDAPESGSPLESLLPLISYAIKHARMSQNSSRSTRGRVPGT